MHRYGDGREGLAAFCDVCGERIEQHGYIVWKPDNVENWLLIHQGRCDPGRQLGYENSMPLDVEIIYLANSASVDLKNAQQRAAVMASA